VTNCLRTILIAAWVLMAFPAVVGAGGPFGPPQPATTPESGLHTAIGYWRQQGVFTNAAETLMQQNQVYSEAGYGFGDRWEVTARLGLSDLRMVDFFNSYSASTSTSKQDFTEGWKFFATLGAKYFLPLDSVWGVGAFVQGTYYFSDFSDNVQVTAGGATTIVETALKDLRDINVGAVIQAALPGDAKLFAGPCICYSEATLFASTAPAGLGFAAGDERIRNKRLLGGFAGAEVELAKGFRLNVEARYAERLSAGAAVTYVY